MKIYLFAGPNGSGKSTIIANYIRDYKLDDVEYICPDIYASELFGDVPDVRERYIKAMDFAEYKRKRLFDEGSPMIVETVLSGKDKIEFLRQAKESGYRIISVFVGTDSPEINIARVAKRVSEGGHDVPSEKVRDRYAKSMCNLPLLSEVSDEIYVYDNSIRPRLVAAVIDGAKYETDDAPDWARNI
ncbi:MAG TPA: AAA family ATPase [Bacillota bacterium]|nr:AAA family ATPase [Bacillota bacterium]